MTPATPDRRSSDRLLLEFENQINERLTSAIASIQAHITNLQRTVQSLQEDLKIMDREGTRAMGTVSERLLGFEKRAEDLIRSSEKEHESIRSSIAEVRRDVDRAAQLVTQANLDKLPDRVVKLEDENSRRLGAQLGAKTTLTVYLGGGLALLGFLYEVAVKLGHG